jgi:hypothetical protein
MPNFFDRLAYINLEEPLRILNLLPHSNWLWHMPRDFMAISAYEFGMCSFGIVMTGLCDKNKYLEKLVLLFDYSQLALAGSRYIAITGQILALAEDLPSVGSSRLGTPENRTD